MTRRPACPVQGCDLTRHPAHVMCRRCWDTVPPALQREVWRTFRTLGVLSDEYRDAREQALDHAESALASVTS